MAIVEFVGQRGGECETLSIERECDGRTIGVLKYISHYSFDEVIELIAIIYEEVYHSYRCGTGRDVEPDRKRQKCSMTSALILSSNLFRTIISIIQ